MVDNKMAADEKVVCPECGSSVVIKKGEVKQRSGKKQKYSCKNCGKIFSDKRLKNSTYSARVVMKALCDYNQGKGLEESSLEINKKFGVKTYPRLISYWLNKFDYICSFRKYRKVLGKCLEEVVFKKEFKHKLPYLFQYHKKKLKLFVNKYFRDLRDYLKRLPYECPNKLFNEDNYRCSQLSLGRTLSIRKKENMACKISEFALKCVKNNHERHDFVEDFMLYNDSSTVAVEVPVWLYPSEVPPELRGVLDLDKPLTGHIDILQLRYGLVYVLDFKPGASKENFRKVSSQLFAYSVALSVRTGKWLRNFRCAWFDDKDYYEFSPSEVVLKHIEKNKNLKQDEEILRKYKLDKKANKYYTGKRFHKERLRRGGTSLMKRLRREGKRSW